MSKPKDKPHQTIFSPTQEVVKLLPNVKGNDINGLGEITERRATPIMWHDSDILEFGELQRWFRTYGVGSEAMEHRKSNRAFVEKSLPDVASTRPNWGLSKWAAEVKAAALRNEADLVGYTRLDPKWIFDGYETSYQWVVVLAVAMDYRFLSTAPGEKSQAEVQKQYGRGTRVAYKLATWMREHGWDAEPHGGPEAGPILMIPAAISAGLGELGKHGSMINRRFGSSFRLAYVLTDMPLLNDTPDVFGAADFCTLCQACTQECPVDAITPSQQLVRGENKWYVDFDQCILYFVENNGCGICIAVCPWSRPGVAPTLVEKMSRRRKNEKEKL